MPLTNYCTHCKTEVPPQSVCPHCGKKLAKSGERLSFTVERRPVDDWFHWNAVLRVAVPVLVLVFAAATAFEAATEGSAGVADLLGQGLPGTLIGILFAFVCLTGLALFLQGKETVRYVLDKEGAHAYVYLRSPRRARLYARFLTPGALNALQADAPETGPEGLSFIRRADLRWADVKRVQFWPQAHTALLYRPRWWQAMVVRADAEDYGQAEGYIRSKTGRRGKRRPKRGPGRQKK